MDKAARAALLTAKGMDKTSENIADYVADMLRQGRAKEITDDLMEQADPQRLMHHYKSGNTGMDLPMDKASRMARAAQMGLTEDSLHGTLAGKDFSRFKGADRYGSRLGQENYVAPNTTDGRKLAAQFSTGDQGRIMPLLTPKPLDTSTLDDRLQFEKMMEDKNRMDDFRMKGGYRVSGLPGWGDQWAIDTVNEAGVPAMKLHERDWVTSTAVFDPTKMRSQFARFDPRLDHLAHLNASAGGAMDFARHVEAVQRAGGQIAPSKYLPNVPRQVHAGGGKVEDAINALPHVGQNRNGVPPEEAVASPFPRMEYPYMSMTPAKSVYADPLRVAINKAHAGAKVEDVPMDKIVTDVGAIGKSKIRNPAEGVPFVERINGVHHLRDGNHRAAAAFLRGDKSIKALVADMDEAIKANGRSATERADGGKVAFQEGNHPDVPEVLYHGNAPKIAAKGWTNEVDEDQTQKNIAAQDFRTFRPSEYGNFGPGIYLSDSPTVASNFAQGIRGERTEALPHGQVFKLHVSMKKPFTDSVLRHPAWKDYIKNEIKKALWLDPTNTNNAKESSEQLFQKLDNDTATVRDLFLRDTPDGTMVNQFGQEKIHKTIRNSGFDGVIAHRPDGSKEYVAFKPEQVKSATGNQGTFDPNDPDITKAGGGEVVNLGKEKLVRSITKAASDVKSGAHQERMDQRAHKLHESGHLPLPIGTKVTPPQGWDMPSELHIHGYWQDILHPEQHGYKLKSESGDLYEVQHQMHSGQNPYVFGGGFKAYSGPVRNRAGYSDEAMAPRNPILPTRTPEQSDQLNKEYDQLFGTEPDITKAEGGSVTDSDEFRNWFGNSVTHTDGDPHVFYTGTSKDKDFTSFNVGRHGAWFTRDPAEASEYAERNDSQGYKHEAGWKLTPTNTAGRVIPAYVKAENPYTGDLPDEVLRSNYKAAQSDWFDTLRRKGHDAWVPARYNGDLVVALREPQQIKSIFNNGKFDPKQKHMNKAGGGEVDDDGITAYHGSPHSFDKFDISKLGTGEGAQAYGHGLYFAGNEGIAKSYRDKLSMGASSIDGRPMADIADEKHKLPYGQNPTIEHNIADIVSSYGDNARPVMQKRYPELLSAYDNMVSNGRISSGHMYKVKLNVKPHELLDWDKPLSEQPHVLNAIGNRYGDPEIVMQQLGNDVNTATGRDLHDALSGMGQDKQLAAKNLQDMGLKGIRYLDAGSRNDTDGDPTHNYVMFHHDPVQVVDKYEYGGTVDDDPAPVIQNPMSIFPKPQRMFPEDQRPKGGQYISAHNKADVTGHKAEAATIGIGPNGKPFFQASQNAVDQTGTVGKGSATTKTNLFKQKAGWKWQDAPEGHENTETIVSVEHRGKHFYALNAHFPKGVDLARYENATSEPRLRPTTQGNVTLGPQAGSISVRGKMHPVYHHVIVKADGGSVDDALALTRRFTKDGAGATMALKPKGK